MKKIISGNELQLKMHEAINLLCDTVKCTLGPKGNNVIIDHSSFTPFITNDGVTIAENIQSDDEVINVILEIAKEASIKTNIMVGDGTTTTLVILQSLFNSCIKAIKDGENTIVLKQKLNKSLDIILKSLEKEKIILKDNMIENLAMIASNDTQISKVVSEVFSKVSIREAISIIEIDENKLFAKYYKGYKFNSILASAFLLKSQNSIIYNNCEILIIDNLVTSTKFIASILNDVMNNSKSIIIIANDFSDYFVNEIVTYVLNDNLKCLLIKIDECGIMERLVKNDLEILSGSKIVKSEEDITVSNIGFIKSVFLTRENTRINFEINDIIEKYSQNIESELLEIKEEYIREFYLKRLAMFNEGTVEINLGAPTKIELREKRMRLEDALCSVYSSNEGILLGGGYTLLKISDSLNDNDLIENIWKNALLAPFNQLMINSGLDCLKIKEKILLSKYNLLFNIYDEEFEEIDKTIVIDSFRVVMNSIINACSIVSMLITTNSLIINEQLNNLHKNAEYGDI